MIARRLLRRLLPQRAALRLRREWLARQIARDSRNDLVEVTSRVHERNYWFFPKP